jgi:hypothetical protein
MSVTKKQSNTVVLNNKKSTTTTKVVELVMVGGRLVPDQNELEPGVNSRNQ